MPFAVERPDMPIILITGYGDVPRTAQAMKAGALEFLTKPLSDEMLLSAIRQVIERSHAGLDHEAELRSLRDCHASLSSREREVTYVCPLRALRAFAIAWSMYASLGERIASWFSCLCDL